MLHELKYFVGFTYLVEMGILKFVCLILISISYSCKANADESEGKETTLQGLQSSNGTRKMV